LATSSFASLAGFANMSAQVLELAKLSLSTLTQPPTTLRSANWSLLLTT